MGGAAKARTHSRPSLLVTPCGPSGGRCSPVLCARAVGCDHREGGRFCVDSHKWSNAVSLGNLVTCQCVFLSFSHVAVSSFSLLCQLGHQSREPQTGAYLAALRLDVRGQGQSVQLPRGRVLACSLSPSSHHTVAERGCSGLVTGLTSTLSTSSDPICLHIPSHWAGASAQDLSGAISPQHFYFFLIF